MTNKSKFKVGDKVFAKVRGHPHWPALINSIDHTSKLPKYHVTFYGTKEIAILKEINLCLFVENKARFRSTKKKIKNLDLALREAEISFNNMNSTIQHMNQEIQYGTLERLILQMSPLILWNVHLC